MGSSVKKRLKVKVDNLTDIEKMGSLILDEITIGPSEEYISQLDKFVGKIDMGGVVEPGDENKLATKMLGFVFVGLNTSYKIPVAYFLVNQLTAEQQEVLTLHVIKDVEETGFSVIRLVADNLSVNTTMFKRINGGELHPVVRHPVQGYNEDDLVFIPWVSSVVSTTVTSRKTSVTSYFNKSTSKTSTCDGGFCRTII